ncbi:MAG: DUF3192 domain-containing protein [bacterium]|nr:MAG: DUF3192 domain-containing protein [bacterium]
MADGKGIGSLAFLTLLLLVLLTGCRHEDQQAGRALGPGGVTRGMTRVQVQEAMLDEVRRLQMVGRVRNPYSTELYRTPQGTIYEVMFYYTGLEAGDNRISDDELVPIILRDGVVEGWGWDELRSLGIIP